MKIFIICIACIYAFVIFMAGVAAINHLAHDEVDDNNPLPPFF